MINLKYMRRETLYVHNYKRAMNDIFFTFFNSLDIDISANFIGIVKAILPTIFLSLKAYRYCIFFITLQIH